MWGVIYIYLYLYICVVLISSSIIYSIIVMYVYICMYVYISYIVLVLLWYEALTTLRRLPSFLSPLRQEETIDRDSETRQFQWLIASNRSGYCMAWIIIIVQFDWIPNSIFNDRSLWIWIFSWQTEPSFPENLKNFQGRTFYMQRKIENYLLTFKMSKENF